MAKIGAEARRERNAQQRADRGSDESFWTGEAEGLQAKQAAEAEERAAREAADRAGDEEFWTRQATEAQKTKTAQDKADRLAPLEDRFGHDLAWLDDAFKEKVHQLGESQRSKVYSDPQMVAKQNQALDSLFGIARDGGATAQERARREGARADEEDWLRGQREADMADMAERGMSGSGQQILNLAADREAAAKRMNKSGLDTDAWLEQRALDATMQGGELAGKMRDTDFAEKGYRAEGADDFSALNTDYLNKAEASYADYKRKAQETMLAERRKAELKRLELGIGAAQGLIGGAQSENQAGYGYAGDVASESAGQVNDATETYNNFVAGGIPGKAEAQKESTDELGNLMVSSGQLGDSVISTVAGAQGGGAGAGLSQSGDTWAGGGSAGGYGSAPTVADVTGKDEED